MGNSNLDRIKSQHPGLPRSMQQELASQLDELDRINRVTIEGSNRETARMKQTSSQISSMLDKVGRTLDDYESLPPSQRRELESQANLVLDHSRAELNAAYEQTMRQIHTTPPRKQGSGSDFLDGFVDELRKNFFGD